MKILEEQDGLFQGSIIYILKYYYIDLLAYKHFNVTAAWRSQAKYFI